MQPVKTLAPLVALALCYAFFFGYVFGTYPQLPARLASHFDASGQPNGWMSRDVCADFTLGLGIMLPVFILAIISLMGLLSASLVKMPNRDYWLAPERRRATTGILFRFGLWFACLNVLFITGIHWLIVQSNVPGQSPQLDVKGLLFLTTGFMAVTCVWVVLLVFRFSRKN